MNHERFTVDNAREICGGLARTSKMPCPSYSLPAAECHVGSKLEPVAGSVCHGCYARKGKYPIPVVQAALYRRLATLRHPRWSDAVATLIRASSTSHFRWHDSGDLQGRWHLDNIITACRLTPLVRHWLPTKEYAIVRSLRPRDVPRNLTIRLSAPMLDGKAPIWWRQTSTVVSDGSHSCPAPSQHNACGLCRDCWSKSVATVSYKHK